MKKYFKIYAKRIAHLLPFVLCVTAVLFGSLTAVFLTLQELDANSEARMKIKIGVVGTANNQYLDMGIAAFQTMDTTRFSMELLTMTEEEAEAAMNRRDISAYVVFPQGFIDAFLSGKIMPIRYVSTSASPGMVTLAKDEITIVLERIILQSQKGAYGLWDAMDANGLRDHIGNNMDKLAIEYVELVLDRGKFYTATEVGIAGGLDMQGYLLSGLSVVFMLLICMPYTPMLIRTDRTMERLLASRQVGVCKQIAVEFSVFFLSLSVLMAGAFAVLFFTGLLDTYSLTSTAILKALPALLALASWSFLGYEISRNYISGVFLQFFSALCMAFISGCLYPAYFFPEPVQIFGGYLPAGAARIQLANCLTGGDVRLTTGILLGYSGVFLVFAASLRYGAVRGDGR